MKRTRWSDGVVTRFTMEVRYLPDEVCWLLSTEGLSICNSTDTSSIQPTTESAALQQYHFINSFLHSSFIHIANLLHQGVSLLIHLQVSFRSANYLDSARRIMSFSLGLCPRLPGFGSRCPQESDLSRILELSR